MNDIQATTVPEFINSPPPHMFVPIANTSIMNFDTLFHDWFRDSVLAMDYLDTE